MNLLEEVQRYVADKLNADPQLSACPFLVENRRDIDYEIKNALGREGIVGLVMTPKARYAGAYMDVGIAWQIDELEIDIVENVTVNRGKKSGYITGQDAAMRLFEVLCPLSGEHEGQFNPVSYEEGEDGSLLVNKSVLKCLVHVAGSQPTPPPFFPDRQAIKMSDGTVIPMGDGFFSPTGYDINTTLRTLGYTVDDVAEIYVFSKLDSTLVYREHLKAAYIDSSCPSIGKDYWSQPFSGSNLEKVVFKGRTYAEIAQMEYYPWGLTDLNKIIALDDTPIPTKVEYTTASGLPDWEADIVGQLSANSIPNKSSVQSIDIGNRVNRIGQSAFEGCGALTSVTIPGSVTSIETQTFSTCTSLTSVTFSDKDMATVQGMENYSWGLPSGCVIHCTDGDITMVDYSKLLLWKTDGEMVEVNAPATVTSQTVEQALYPSQRSTVAKAHIPDSVTNIAYGVFFGCEHLTSIYISKGATALGADLFFNCSSLQTLTIPAAVASIGDYALYGCSSLTGVTFEGKTLQQVRAMNGYPWGVSDTSIIHAELS